MKSKSAILSAILVLSLLCPTAALAQAASSDWSAVQAVPSGEKIFITLKSGKSVSGKVTSVTETGVSIERKNKTETFTRDTIAEVRQAKRKAEKGKYAAIGAAIGGGTGLGIGLAKNSPPVDDGGIYPVIGTILGAGIGAVGGFLFGQAKRKRVLIYQAK